MSPLRSALLRTGLILFLTASPRPAFPAVPASRGADSKQGAGEETGLETDLHYRIEAEIDLDHGRIQGEAMLAMRAAAPGDTSRIWLDPLSAGRLRNGAPRMRVESVRVGASALDLSCFASGEPIVVRERGAQPSESLRVRIAYSITVDPEDAATMGYYLYGAHDARSAWYPDLVRGTDRRERFRSFDVVLTHPDSVTLLTSGQETAPARVRGAQTVQTFQASRLEGFALAFQKGYRLTSVSRGDARVVAFTAPNLAPAYRVAAETTLDAITWYREKYGFFPVPQIGLLQGHPQFSGGFPLPNLFMVHRGNLTPEYIRFITAHELGHYYWGLHVLGDAERLDWLQLSLGIWGDQLYLAESSGRSLEAQWRSTGGGDWYVDYARSFLGNHEQTIGLTESEATNLEFDYNSLVRHAKAAVGLHLQARQLGIERFLELERRILDEYRDRPLPVERFLDLLEAAGAEGSREFLRAWMRGDGMLAYAADVTAVRRTTEGWIYTISLTRRGTVTYPVTIEILDEQGTIVRREMAGRESEESTEVTLPGRLAELRLDPDGILPLENGWHPEIRRIFLLAMSAEEVDGPFIPLAKEYLEAHPDDQEMRRVLGTDLFTAGRYAEARAVLDMNRLEAQSDPVGCRAALVLVRALVREGNAAEAGRLLESLQEPAIRFGQEARWRSTAQEVEAARSWPGGSSGER